MRTISRSVFVLLLLVGFQLAGAQPNISSAQEKKINAEKTLTISVSLPDGKPAVGATVIRHAQFSSGKPVWIGQRLGEGRSSVALVANKKGRINWTNFDIGRSSPLCLILSSDQKFGHFFLLKDVDLSKKHSVKLSPMMPMYARFDNPQAKKAKIPFLHRGYIYLASGERFAHVVGESAKIYLPAGFYTMNGYNGNGNNIQVEVPKFKYQFEVASGGIKDIALIEGHAEHNLLKLEQKSMLDLGFFHHADGFITFKPNTLHNDYQGNLSFKLRFNGADGKPYRGKQVFVRDTEKRNTYIYYGKMPQSGTLDLGKVAEGKYRVEVDGHTPKGCYKIDLTNGEELSVKQPISMPVMPGYQLDNLHLLDPVSLEKKDLKGYQGKVVYIEFWASWCGPCMQAMNHVEAILSKRKSRWGDRVALVAVNVNENPDETIKKYTKIYGWKSFQHLYGGEEGKNDFQATALKQLQINGIPHAMILGPDGKMIWRGHPESIDVGVAIEKALNQKKDAKKE